MVPIGLQWLGDHTVWLLSGALGDVHVGADDGVRAPKGIEVVRLVGVWRCERVLLGREQRALLIQDVVHILLAGELVEAAKGLVVHEVVRVHVIEDAEEVRHERAESWSKQSAKCLFLVSQL